MACPCGSRQLYSECCGPVITHVNATDPETLMRSRYTAYTLRNTDYLLATWHTSTRPASLELQHEHVNWVKLKILGRDDTHVLFIAYFADQQQFFALKENSRFVYENKQWFYLDGENESFGPLSKNGDCPCGSGKKFKRCCTV